MWHYLERLAGSLVLAGVLWLAWITPDELVTLLIAAATQPAVWRDAAAGAAAVLLPVLLWRALRLLADRRTPARPGRLRV